MKYIEQYSKINWKDGRNTENSTPLSADNLNHMDNQIYDITSFIKDEGALGWDIIFQGSGPNKAQLDLSAVAGDITKYKLLFIKGWIDKEEGNNYAFTVTLPVTNLADGGMFVFTDYDEMYHDGYFRGTITSIVIRYTAMKRQPNPSQPAWYEYFLYVANRKAVTEQDGKEVLIDFDNKTQGIGAVGRYLDNLGAVASPPYRDGDSWSQYDKEYRTVTFQEVYGLR